MEGRRVGEGGDMTGKSPTGEDYYENLGGGRIIGEERTVFLVWIFSGVGSLVLEFW
jgi:hypothetical protein